ncbi:protein kinase [Planotetraspora sp. A-T 1434]|nr:serine/threonine-protein kinase [Planotetraspora sp. A-T 1434]MCT9931541.1 protein kinase [Planotetraspora sp. A-T 1434]
MRPTGAEPLSPDDPAAIGPYRLLGRLGEGGMGTVYLAVAPAGQVVAVKVVKTEFTADDDFAARFHAEVDNARRVASFCTAQVLDNSNAADGRPYMVTEYIAGTPLSRQITTYGPLGAGPLHGVALGVAAALAAIHVAGLVHRDLKPANVILSMSGPRVIDFGIARALDTTHSFTQSGELLGSPGWWAPEQVRGEEITPATDIFAWGCLVGYAGSGRHPYGRGDAVTLAARVVNNGPDLGVLPPPLDELTRRATHPDPAQRPSAQDLLLALVGGVAPVPDRPSPAVTATEMLTESWEPPPNVAAEPDATQILGAPTATEPGLATRWRSRASRWLFAAAAVVVALGVTVGVLVTARQRPGDAGTVVAAKAPAAGKAPAVGADVGRRIRLAGTGTQTPGTQTSGTRTPGTRTPGAFTLDTQILVPQQPRCGLPAYESVTATKGGLCVVRWTMVNLGGDLAPVSTMSPRLFDDRGGEHDADKASTPLPTALVPGAKVDGVLIFDLPPGRKPTRLVLTDGVEVQL